MKAAGLTEASLRSAARRAVVRVGVEPRHRPASSSSRAPGCRAASSASRWSSGCVSRNATNFSASVVGCQMLSPVPVPFRRCRSSVIRIRSRQSAALTETRSSLGAHLGPQGEHALAVRVVEDFAAGTAVVPAVRAVLPVGGVLQFVGGGEVELAGGGVPRRAGRPQLGDAAEHVIGERRTEHGDTGWVGGAPRAAARDMTICTLSSIGDVSSNVRGNYRGLQPIQVAGDVG